MELNSYIVLHLTCTEPPPFDNFNVFTDMYLSSHLHSTWPQEVLSKCVKRISALHMLLLDPRQSIETSKLSLNLILSESFGGKSYILSLGVPRSLVTSSHFKTVHVCRSWLSKSLGFVGQETFYMQITYAKLLHVFPQRHLQGSGESDSGAVQATKANY